MTVLKLNIPENLHLSDFDLKMLIASKLFEEGQLSSGQAAQIVGLSKRAFVEIVGKFNVSLFGQDITEIEEDFENA